MKVPRDDPQRFDRCSARSSTAHPYLLPLQHEFGLQRAAELPVGGVETVRGLEAVEPLQGGRRGGVPGGERRVELADAIPLRSPFGAEVVGQTSNVGEWPGMGDAFGQAGGQRCEGLVAAGR